MEQWIALYNKKVREGFERDTRFALLYSPSKGFCEIGDTGDMVIINQVCGDFSFWKNAGVLYAKQHGYKYLGSLVVRPIRPYLRLAGCAISHVEETSIGDRFFCIEKESGRKVEASPADDKGTYCVILEVS